MSTEAKATTQASHRPAKEAEAAPAPIIVDLGKKSRKQVRKLRKGRPGKLLERVEESIEHLRQNGALAANAQPIVIVVKERSKRRGKRIAKAWGLG